MFDFKCTITVLCLYVFYQGTLYSQGLQEARYMNQNDYVSSARIMGTGNVMGALGGDLGAINLNPASIATFRNSYVPIIGLGINVNNTDPNTEAWKESRITSSSKVFLSNIGFIIQSNPQNTNIKTLNFGISFNRISNFNENINVHGYAPGSIAQRWVQIANGLTPDELQMDDPFEAYQAYETGAIYLTSDDPGANSYLNDYQDQHYLNKEISYHIFGGANELNMSLGMNLNEKVLIGGSIGIPFFNLTSDRVYKEYENALEPDTSLYEKIDYLEYSSTNGFGFNFDIGAIFVPTHFMRLGVNFKSPRWYKNTTNYRTSVFFNNNKSENTPVEGYYEYRYKTPWVVGAQLSFLFMKYGFLSAEIEYSDHAQSAFNYSSTFVENEDNINNELKNELGSTLKVRIGGELALNTLRLRTGVAFNQTGYSTDKKFYPQYHVGFGLRGEHYFFDLAYKYSFSEYLEIPYTNSQYATPSTTFIENNIPIKSKNHIIMATIGFGL